MSDRPAILYALLSAALFGLSTPAAKFLLGTIDPGVLVGIFYCGAGIGTALLRRVRPKNFLYSENKLQREDIPWLAGAVLSGGVIGPLLLFLGLRLTDAATASLLLTLETVATGLIAWIIFQRTIQRTRCVWDGAVIGRVCDVGVVWHTEPRQFSRTACCYWCLHCLGH